MDPNENATTTPKKKEKKQQKKPTTKKRKKRKRAAQRDIFEIGSKIKRETSFTRLHSSLNTTTTLLKKESTQLQQADTRRHTPTQVPRDALQFKAKANVNVRWGRGRFVSRSIDHEIKLLNYWRHAELLATLVAQYVSSLVTGPDTPSIWNF